MRVITGKAKGHRLRSVPGGGTRPITDRAKESLFNIVSGYIVGSRFLDLFAGTGGVGIEALSRGAQEAVFVELAQDALHTIHQNLEHTQLEDGAIVVRANVFEFLLRDPDPFDFVYVAPPQYKGLWIRTLHILDERTGWLFDDGWVIVQIDPDEYEKQELKNLVLFDQRSYGGVMLCFYAPEPAQE
jgi:16S rRNA (guanine966-N2)-methyltransferase